MRVSSELINLHTEQCQTEASRLLDTDIGRIMKLLGNRFGCKNTPFVEMTITIADALRSATSLQYLRDIEPQMHILTSNNYSLNVSFGAKGIQIMSMSKYAISYVAQTLASIKNFDNSSVQRALLLAEMLRACRCKDCINGYSSQCFKKELVTCVNEHISDLFEKTACKWLLGNDTRETLDRIWIEAVKQIKSADRLALDTTSPIELSKKLKYISPNNAPYRMLKLRAFLQSWFTVQYSSICQCITYSRAKQIMEINYSTHVDHIEIGIPTDDAFGVICEYLRKQNLSEHERKKERNEAIEREKDKARYLKKCRATASDFLAKLVDFVRISKVQVDLACATDANTVHNDLENEFKNLVLPDKEFLNSEGVTSLNEQLSNYTELLSTLRLIQDQEIIRTFHERLVAINVRSLSAIKDLTKLEEEMCDKKGDIWNTIKLGIQNKISQCSKEKEMIDFVHNLHSNMLSSDEKSAFGSGIVQWMIYGNTSDPLTQIKTYDFAVNMTVSDRYNDTCVQLMSSLEMYGLQGSDTWIKATVMTALAETSPILFSYLDSNDPTTIRRIFANHLGASMETRRKFCWHCCSIFPTVPFEDGVNHHLKKSLSKNSLHTHLLEIGYISPEQVVHVELSGSAFMFDGCTLKKNGKSIQCCNHKEIYDMLVDRRETACKMKSTVDRIHPIVFAMLDHKR